jgi:hypothetical protein
MSALRKVARAEFFAGMHKLQVQKGKLKRIQCWYGQREIEVLEDEVRDAERQIEVHPVTQTPTLIFESKRGGRWRVKFRIPGIVGVDDWVHKRNRIYLHFLWDHPKPDRPTEEVNLIIPRGRSVVELHFSPSLVKPNGYSGVILLLGEETGTDPSTRLVEWIAGVRLNIPVPAKNCLRPLHKYHTPLFFLPDDEMKRSEIMENILELCEEAKGPWKQTKTMTTIVTLTQLSREEKERFRDGGLRVVEFEAKEGHRLSSLLEESEELFSAPRSDILILSSGEAISLASSGVLAAALGCHFAPQMQHIPEEWTNFLIYFLESCKGRLRKVIVVGRPDDINMEFTRILFTGLKKRPRFTQLSPREALEEVIRQLSLDMIEFNTLRGFDDASELEREVGEPIDVLREENSEALGKSVILKLIIPQVLVLAAYRQNVIEDLLLPLSYSISRRAPLVLLPSPEKEVLMETAKALNQVAGASIEESETLKTWLTRLTLSLFGAIPPGTKELLDTTISRMTTAFTPDFLPFELASRKSELDEDLDPWGALFSISRLSGSTPRDTCSLSAFSTLSCLKPSSGSQAIIITNPTTDLPACAWETGAVLPRMIVSGLDIDPKNDVLGADGQGVEKYEAERRMNEADFIHYSGHALLCFRGEENCGQHNPQRGCRKTGRRHDGCLPFLDRTSVDGWIPLPSNEIIPLGRSPFVFMNACHSGSPKLARSFLRAGAKGYVGTLWSVSDTVAALIGANFYEAIARSTVTDALRFYRQAMRARFGFEDSSWLAYIAYGDPASSTTLHTQDSFWEASYFEALANELRKRDDLRGASLAYGRADQLAKESILTSGDDITKQLSIELESRSAANALESKAELESTPLLKARLFQDAAETFREAASTATYVDDIKRNTSSSHEAEANASISLSEVHPERGVELLLNVTKELFVASDSHPEQKTRKYYAAQAAYNEAGALYYSAREEDAGTAVQKLFSALWCLDNASRDSVLSRDVEGPKRAIWKELDELINRSRTAGRTMIKIQDAFSMTHDAETLQKSAEELRESGDLSYATSKYREASVRYREASNLYRGLSELSGSMDYCRGMMEYCSGMSERCRGMPSSASNRLLSCCNILRRVRGPQTQRRLALERANRAESNLASIWIESIPVAQEAKQELEEAGKQYDMNELSQSKKLFGKAHGHFLESAKEAGGAQRSFLDACALRAKEGEIRSEAKSVEIGGYNLRNGITDLGLVERLWRECIRLLEEAKNMYPLEIYKRDVEEEIEGIRYDLYLCQKLSSGLMQAGYEQTR